MFSFPPDKGNVGTAAYLNVFGSIHKVLKVNSSDAVCTVISASDTCAAVICAACRPAADSLASSHAVCLRFHEELAVPESPGSTVQLACLEPP